jgi:ABC-type transport system involved in cytochrome c biogenesis ATPase subunit
LESTETVLDVAGLGRSYDTHRAVDGLSFQIRAGEILGLVGPNGAGKTTTLRTIAGVLPVKEGRVTIGGFDLARDEERAKRVMRWIPDDPQPFDSLTVHEHLEFTAALYGLGDWKPRAEELLARFELTEKRDAFGGELSRGMRQKLAFCCARRAAAPRADGRALGAGPARHPLGQARDRDAGHGHGRDPVVAPAGADRGARHAARILDRGRNVLTGTLDEAREGSASTRAAR